MRLMRFVPGFLLHPTARRAAQITADLPVGIELNLVADQPHVVKEAVGEFTKTLMEAVAIVHCW